MKIGGYGLLFLGVTLAACAHFEAAPLKVATLSKPSLQASDLPLYPDAHTLLRIALNRDPSIAAARATLRAARETEKAARNLSPLSLTLTTEYSKDADPQRPWLYGGGVAIPFDAGAKHASRLTGADLSVLKARYALGEAIWRTRQRLYTALFNLSLARADVDLSRTLLEQRLAYQTLTQKRVAHGEDAQALASQAALEVSYARQALAQAQTKHVQATADLALVLDCAPATAERMANLPLPSLDTPDDVAIDHLMTQALYSRADVLMAVVDYDIAENDLHAAILAQYPDLTLQPGYTWERGQVKIPFSLALTLPPLDGNRATIAAAQSTRLAAEKTLESIVKATQATVRQTATAYRSDQMTLHTIVSTDVATARDMARQAERTTKAGETDAGEGLLAQMASSQTRLSSLAAERAVNADRLALEDAAHQSLDPVDMEILTQAAALEDFK